MTKQILKTQNRNKRGQSVTEYGIFLAAIVTVFIVAFSLNGPFYKKTNTLFEKLANDIPTYLLLGKSVN